MSEFVSTNDWRKSTKLNYILHFHDKNFGGVIQKKANSYLHANKLN